MPHPRLAILTLCTLAIAPACTTLAEIDATVDQVCLTYPDLQVPAPVAGVTVSGGLVQHFVFGDLAPVHQLLADDAQLQFLHAEVRTSSSDALAGIARASVGIASADPGSTLPRAVVYACDGDCVATDASLELPAAGLSDALAYLSSESLAVDLAASGELPQHAWTMEVDVCMSGQAQYKLQP